jgi:hypothetical protein
MDPIFRICAIRLDLRVKYILPILEKKIISANIYRWKLCSNPTKSKSKLNNFNQLSFSTISNKQEK